jgi:ribosome-binding ATPase YchF (GTP1/OBG family)
MSLNCGIIGLTNTGKTTIFNCMSNTRAEAPLVRICDPYPEQSIAPARCGYVIRIRNIQLHTLIFTSQNKISLFLKHEAKA